MTMREVLLPCEEFPDGVIADALRIPVRPLAHSMASDLAGGKGKSGIGRRTMWFTVDKDGEPHGYVRGSRTAKPKVEAISVGRALPALTKTVSAKRAA